MRYILNPYHPKRTDHVICFDGANLLHGVVVSHEMKYPIFYEQSTTGKKRGYTVAQQQRYCYMVIEIEAISTASLLDEVVYKCFDDCMAFAPCIVPFKEDLWNKLVKLHHVQSKKGGSNNKVLQQAIEQTMADSRGGLNVSDFKLLEELYAKNKKLGK